MSDNHLALYVVLISVVFIMYALWMMKSAGLFASTIVARARAAMRIYKTARTWDQKIFAVMLSVLILTSSAAKGMFALLSLFIIVVLGGVLKFDPFKAAIDLINNLISLISPPAKI